MQGRWPRVRNRLPPRRELETREQAGRAAGGPGQDVGPWDRALKPRLSQPGGGVRIGVPASLAGDTALHVAAYRGYFMMVRELLAQGVDVTIENNIGWTALNSALTARQAEVAELLIDWGCKPNAAAIVQMRDMNLQYGDPRPSPPPRARMRHR